MASIHSKTQLTRHLTLIQKELPNSKPDLSFGDRLDLRYKWVVLVLWVDCTQSDVIVLETNNIISMRIFPFWRWFKMKRYLVDQLLSIQFKSFQFFSFSGSAQWQILLIFFISKLVLWLKIYHSVRKLYLWYVIQIAGQIQKQLLKFMRSTLCYIWSLYIDFWLF